MPHLALLFNRLTATSFGVPAVLLELVPIAGIFFSFTNTVGAALWAADMEQNQQSGGSSTAPNLRNQAERARKCMFDTNLHVDTSILGSLHRHEAICWDGRDE
jgi:hypothetical protein